MKKIIFIIINFLLLSSSWAADINGNFQGSAKLISACTISASNINLGLVDPTGQGSTSVPGADVVPGYTSASGALTLLCSRDLSYTIYMSLGTNTTSGGRYLKGTNTGVKIVYTICKTAAYNPGVNCVSIWTPTVGIGGKGTGTTQVIPTYANLNNQFYTPDTYTDTVTATISY